MKTSSKITAALLGVVLLITLALVLFANGIIPLDKKKGEEQSEPVSTFDALKIPPASRETTEKETAEFPSAVSTVNTAPMQEPIKHYGREFSFSTEAGTESKSSGGKGKTKYEPIYDTDILIDGLPAVCIKNSKIQKMSFTVYEKATDTTMYTAVDKSGDCDKIFIKAVDSKTQLRLAIEVYPDKTVRAWASRESKPFEEISEQLQSFINPYLAEIGYDYTYYAPVVRAGFPLQYTGSTLFENREQYLYAVDIKGSKFSLNADAETGICTYFSYLGETNSAKNIKTGSGADKIPKYR